MILPPETPSPSTLPIELWQEMRPGLGGGFLVQTGAPGETQRSGFAGERRKHGASELSTSGGSEGCEVASDEGEGKHRVRLYTGRSFGALPRPQPLKGRKEYECREKRKPRSSRSG